MATKKPKALKNFDEVLYPASPTNPIYKKNDEEMGDFEVRMKQNGEYVPVAFDPIKPGTLLQHLSCAEPKKETITLEPGRTKEVAMVPCRWRNGSVIIVPMKSLEFVEGEYGDKLGIEDIEEVAEESPEESPKDETEDLS